VTAPLQLTREQILAHRRRAGTLDERLPAGKESLERAALLGLQDSMPRAALLSIHARVEGTQPDAWEHPAFVQVWGPRYNAYVIAARDRALFTLGRLPDGAVARKAAEDLADRLEAALAGRRLPYAEAGRLLGGHGRALGYAAPTGRVLIRWEGARAPLVWTVPRPEMDPAVARLELARRYLHAMGPATPDTFARWGGIRARARGGLFDGLRDELLAVRTPLGAAWILASDEPSFRAAPAPAAACRLLPSGDAYWLLWGTDRELLVADPVLRDRLWPSRVWPGALLVGGEIAGVWRRDQGRVKLEPWRRLSAAERHAVEAEALSLPLPGLKRAVTVELAEVGGGH
jgi:hypothetical protein